MTSFKFCLLVLSAAAGFVSKEATLDAGTRDMIQSDVQECDEPSLAVDSPSENVSFVEEEASVGAIRTFPGLIERWRTPVPKIKATKRLGAGAFGTAFLGYLKRPCDDDKVVIKVQDAVDYVNARNFGEACRKTDKRCIDAWKRESAYAERDVMLELKALTDPYPLTGMPMASYFVKILDAGSGPGPAQYSMLLELANRGTLTDSMYDDSNPRLPPMPVKLPDAVISQILYETLVGLAIMHGNGYVHRDIKPDNVLVTQDEDGVKHAKIADFGLACKRCDGIAGTPLFLPPELFKTSRATPSPPNDVWAVGIMAYQFLHGNRYPSFIRSAPSREALQRALARAPLPNTYIFGDTKLHQLTRKMLDPSPATRASALDLATMMKAAGMVADVPIPEYFLQECFNEAPEVPEQPEAPVPSYARLQPVAGAKNKNPYAGAARKGKGPAAKKKRSGRKAGGARKGRVPIEIRDKQRSLPDEDFDDVDINPAEAEYVTIRVGGVSPPIYGSFLKRVLEEGDGNAAWLEGKGADKYMPKRLKNLDFRILAINQIPYTEFIGDAGANLRNAVFDGAMGRQLEMKIMRH